jgi:hypothetical protein
VFAGFVTTLTTIFLSEPIKIYFTNQSKKNNLRKAIYSEILVIYDRLFYFLVTIEERGFNIDFSTVVNIDFDCYKYAKSDPSLFYKLEEAVLINQFYSNIHILKENEKEISREKHIQLAKLVVFQMEILLANKKLNKSLVLSVSKELGLNGRIRKIINKSLKAGEVTATRKNK